MTYSLPRGAELDLLEAASFYRREGGARLANRFLDEFDRVARLLVEFPGIGTPADEFRRVHPLHDFPYSLIYSEKEATSASWSFAGNSGIPATGNHAARPSRICWRPERPI